MLTLAPVVPLPSWPYWSLPQQYVPTVGFSPQVSKYPAETAEAATPPLVTATGRSVLVVVPLPSSPELLSPQQ